jgi:ribosomal protein S27E
MDNDCIQCSNGKMLPFYAGSETYWICTSCGQRVHVVGGGDHMKLVIDKIPVQKSK